MEARTFRRFGRRSRQSSLLPVGVAAPNHITASTVSCWYCDFKIRVFNEALFSFGRRHAAFLRVWFSIGIGFSLTLLLAVSCLLVWTLFLGKFSNNTAFFFLFGFSPSVSLADAAYLLVSTLISVSVHEFGHAISAASEGVQVEYIAVFFAIVFPGALVAINYSLLQSLPRFTVLRVYCAGIWHNAVCCAVCGLVLFLMPLILLPFYKHGEGPLVLDVPSTSPLLGYLSPGDVIVSLDGRHIHNEQDWMEMAALLDKQALPNSNHSKYTSLNAADGIKGYCIPNYTIEESKKIQLVDNQSACPSDFIAFVTVHCIDISISGNVSGADNQLNKLESRHCLNAKDVVKLNKCGDGWLTSTTDGSSCLCSKDESCLTPVQLPGLIWVEITYSRPYSVECMQFARSSVSDSSTAHFMETYCGGTFVFVGDVISMAHSVSLTAYQPRWAAFSPYLPNMLEKSLLCLFHVSLTLALLNSLPVIIGNGKNEQKKNGSFAWLDQEAGNKDSLNGRFMIHLSKAYFLDGESILEEALSFFSSLNPRKRGKVLQVCLLGGTIISILAFFRVFFFNFL